MTNEAEGVHGVWPSTSHHATNHFITKENHRLLRRRAHDGSTEHFSTTAIQAKVFVGLDRVVHLSFSSGDRTSCAGVGLGMPAPLTGMTRTVPTARARTQNSTLNAPRPIPTTPRRRRRVAAAGSSVTTLRLCWILWVAHFGSLLCAGVQAPNTPPWLLRASTLQRFLT